MVTEKQRAAARQNIKKAIKATKDFPGITGKISFGDSNVPQKGVTVIAIKDSKFTLGAELVPEKVPAPASPLTTPAMLGKSAIHLVKMTSTRP